LLFFGVLAPIIHAQTVPSNSFCTNVGGADPKQNPCAQAAGNLTFYCQHDDRWRKNPYACENMSGAGCGPTTMAMVLSAYGMTLTPAQIAEMFTPQFSVCNVGTDMVSALGKGEKPNRSFIDQVGLEVGKNILINGKLDLDLAQEYLRPSSGYLIIGSSINFPTCGCGHIFVIQAADPTSNMIKIRDPNNCSISSPEERPSGIDYPVSKITSWLFAYPVKKVK